MCAQVAEHADKRENAFRSTLAERLVIRWELDRLDDFEGVVLADPSLHHEREVGLHVQTNQ